MSGFIRGLNSYTRFVVDLLYDPVGVDVIPGEEDDNFVGVESGTPVWLIQEEEAEPFLRGWGVVKGDGDANFRPPLDSQLILCGVDIFLDREIDMRLKIERSFSV